MVYQVMLSVHNLRTKFELTKFFVHVRYKLQRLVIYAAFRTWAWQGVRGDVDFRPFYPEPSFL